ncbi:activator of HSP90 ATPase [Actinomadura sp. NBRC 104412]|uniref:SRPBCC family protein n=1 Tax=Actinomadura sp. NBRC 104412 TaxID=3032203 RepID=UPI0024A17149|nr:SRPBCC domain-containing protein [Actinomadura sp. NBRC 104412]GLZ05532.1 activator of HSP90 ATPase [Actinomadura sp. NBRC 104412]
MSITSLDKDLDALTLRLTAEFDAPVERVWRLWSDPRRLERWWGPPTYPATVEEHDLTPGGEVTYYMTGPDGDKAHGYWRITAVEPPRSLEFVDGFADQDGRPAEDMPTNTTRVRLTGRGDGGTRMELQSVFDSRDHMEQLMKMGMAEGLRAAVGQIDGLLAA